MGTAWTIKLWMVTDNLALVKCVKLVALKQWILSKFKVKTKVIRKHFETADHFEGQLKFAKEEYGSTANYSL